jgi:hypothetical protein
VCYRTGLHDPETRTPRFVHTDSRNVRKNSTFRPVLEPINALLYEDIGLFISAGSSQAIPNLYRSTCAEIRVGELKREHSYDRRTRAGQ